MKITDHLLGLQDGVISCLRRISDKIEQNLYEQHA